MGRNQLKIYREIIINLLGNVCSECNSKDKEFHIHHKDNNYNNNSKDNILLKCKDCHIKLHTRENIDRSKNILIKLNIKKEKKEITESIKLTCKYCGKVIESLYEKQAEYNLKAHEISCEKKGEEKK